MRRAKYFLLVGIIYLVLMCFLYKLMHSKTIKEAKDEMIAIYDNTLKELDNMRVQIDSVKNKCHNELSNKLKRKLLRAMAINQWTFSCVYKEGETILNDCKDYTNHAVDEVKAELEHSLKLLMKDKSETEFTERHSSSYYQIILEYLRNSISNLFLEIKSLTFKNMFKLERTTMECFR